MQIKIESVNLNEIQELADISRKCFYDTFHAQNSAENMKLFLDESFNVETLEEEMLQPANYFFFAKMGDEIVGYIKLSDTKPAFMSEEVLSMEIARIYVVKDKIGSGIGKRLIEFAFSFSRKLTRNVIWLGVWEHNLRAIHFYRNWGFEKFGEHIFMVGNDAQTDWLMKRDIEDRFNS
jgi:ribosomal protein S18 acetylase RimI-like enzyme